MSKISIIAKLTAAEGRADELRAALAGLIVAADAEDGLEVYAANVADDDPDTFYFYEVYTDQAAIDVHGKAEPMIGAMQVVGGLLAGRPEITRMTTVAAKGLEA